MLSKAATVRGWLERAERPVVVVGAHDGLGAVLAAQAGYDAVWASSFEISAAHALPDASLLGMSDYLRAARVMNAASPLPVIADCDTGFGNSLNVAHTVHEYEAAGIAAICLEDKVFPKLNSFAGGRQELAPTAEFQHKIATAKAAQYAPDLVVIARTEALVVGQSVQQALSRANAYADAGADAVLIHSKASTPVEVEAFLAGWQRRLPVVVVPTTYYGWTLEDAARAGVAVVIYANQGLRATVTALRNAFAIMLKEGGSSSLEDSIASVQEIFALQQLDTWLALEVRGEQGGRSDSATEV